jgi:heme/copper-type cytochrome/quinol oxidase subunit 4
MKLDLKIDPDKEGKFFNVLFFSATYIVAIYGGLWWIDDDLFRGIIFILGLYIFSIHMGLKYNKGQSRYYVFFAFILPPTLGTILFLVGLLKPEFNS